MDQYKSEKEWEFVCPDGTKGSVRWECLPPLRKFTIIRKFPEEAMEEVTSYNSEEAKAIWLAFDDWFVRLG